MVTFNKKRPGSDFEAQNNPTYTVHTRRQKTCPHLRHEDVVILINNAHKIWVLLIDGLNRWCGCTLHQEQYTQRSKKHAHICDTRMWLF